MQSKQKCIFGKCIDFEEETTMCDMFNKISRVSLTKIAEHASQLT